MRPKAGESERVTTGVSELDIALSGGFPRRSAILVNGGPGTGKTILGITFLWNGIEAGENGVFVSLSEAKREMYENMEKFGMDLKKVEDQGKFGFLEIIGADGKAMGDQLAQVFGVISKIGAKRVVIDSYSAITRAFESEYQGRQILSTIVQRLIRGMGCTTLIISEGEFKTSSGYISEGFLTDGVISLADGIPRSLAIHKIRGTAILHRNFLFTINAGGFSVTRTEIVRESPAKRWKPVILADDRVSTGNEDLDKVLGGGFTRGTYAVIVADTNVTLEDIRLFTHAAIWNFLSQGLGVLYLPPGGAGVNEVVGELRRHLELKDLENLRVAEEFKSDEPTAKEIQMSPNVVLLKGGENNIDADTYILFNTLTELKNQTGDNPVLRVIGFDTMDSKYSGVTQKLYNEIGFAIERTRASGCVTFGVARPNMTILAKVLDMVDWQFYLTKVNDTLLFQSIKPQTILYAVICDVSKGYPKVRLVPMS
jgi:KaiC/GvpD/RAD55 family RecA-like ATPase